MRFHLRCYDGPTRSLGINTNVSSPLPSALCHLSPWVVSTGLYTDLVLKQLGLG